MGFQELLLVVLSSVLFSLLILNVNLTSQRNHDALRESEIAHMATSMAQRIIEEAKSKKFDANVGAYDPSTFPDNFTGPGTGLGYNSGVDGVYPNINDVDDFNGEAGVGTGLSVTVTVHGMDFQVLATVDYVTHTNLEQEEFSKTFFKMVTVTVNSAYLPHSVTLKQVISYYGVDEP